VILYRHKEKEKKMTKNFDKENKKIIILLLDNVKNIIDDDSLECKNINTVIEMIERIDTIDTMENVFYNKLITLESEINTIVENMVSDRIIVDEKLTEINEKFEKTRKKL